ncbi:hypothetical protein KBZ21_00640 [Streptomyces sp. A73]|nr:hypothetical protein [Streptomyces sp. A73]
MGSSIGELEARQAAVHSRVAELGEEIAGLTALLEAERERLTRETLAELAAEGIAVDAAAVAPPSAEPVGGGQVVGVQTVHVWQEGMTSVDLPPVYRDIVDVVDDAPAPLQAKQIVPRGVLAAVTLKIEGPVILQSKGGEPQRVADLAALCGG